MTAPAEVQAPPIVLAPGMLGFQVTHAKLAGPEIKDTGDRVGLTLTVLMSRDQAAALINALVAAHRECSPLIVL